METPLIKSFTDLDFQIKPFPTQSFLVANGTNNHKYAQFQISDIEMVAIHSLTYTSLRDLLPASPPSIMSPMSNRKDSWREIPIKDPLVQHAAWAYLQPRTTARESDERSCFSSLKEGLFGCFGGLFNDVVVATIKRWFSENGSEEEEEDEGDKVD